MAAVAHPLALVEPRRKLERQPGLSPGVDAAGERDDCAVAPLAQRLGRAQRAVAVCAIEDDRALPVGLELLVELLHRNVHRVGDPAPLQLPQLADVDEDGRVVRGEQLVRPAGADLEENLTVTASCSKDNRGRMSPRTRVFVVVGAAARSGRRGHRCPGRGHGGRQGRRRAAAAGGTARRRAAARPRPRRPRRPGGSRAATRGAPLLRRTGLVARSGAQRPGGSSGATGRRKPGSARRSRPGRTRAWRSSSSWPASARRDSRVFLHLGLAKLWAGRSRRKRRQPGGRQPRRSRTPPRPNGRTTSCTRTSRRASRSSCRAFRRPRV